MGDKQTTSQCKVVSNQNEHFQSQMQSETTDLFITNEVLSPTELLDLSQKHKNIKTMSF
jgi:hypothetical protein